jgi:hypothetical protein
VTPRGEVVVLAENRDLVKNAVEGLEVENDVKVEDLVATGVDVVVALQNFSRQPVAHATSRVRFPFVQTAISRCIAVRVST